MRLPIDAEIQKKITRKGVPILSHSILNQSTFHVPYWELFWDGTKLEQLKKSLVYHFCSIPEFFLSQKMVPLQK